MAITINQQPQTYSPVYNPLIFVVTSDNIGEDNFNYVFDVYWDGTLQTRHRLPARPDNGKAVFDASRIIESQVTHNIDSVLGFNVNSSSFKKFYVSFGEEFDVSGTLSLTADLEQSDDVYAFNASLDYFEFCDYDEDDYLLADSSSKFLTNSPAQYIRTSEKAYLYTVCNAPVDYTDINLDIYNSSGTMLTTLTIPNTAIGAGEVFVRYMINMPELIALNPGYFVDGNYFDIYAGNSSTPISEKKRYYIDDSCTKYEIFRLHFLNKLGGFDSFSFTKSSKESSSITKAKYKRNLGTMSGSSFEYSKTDRSEYSLSTSIVDSITINSNWITETESEWLKELVTSPVVFHQIGNTLVPITINENKYDIKKKVNDKLFNLSLTFNYSVTNYRQRY